MYSMSVKKKRGFILRFNFSALFVQNDHRKKLQVQDKRMVWGSGIGPLNRPLSPLNSDKNKKTAYKGSLKNFSERKKVFNYYIP